MWDKNNDSKTKAEKNDSHHHQQQQQRTNVEWYLKSIYDAK